MQSMQLRLHSELRTQRGLARAAAACCARSEAVSSWTSSTASARRFAASSAVCEMTFTPTSALTPHADSNAVSSSCGYDDFPKPLIDLSVNIVRNDEIHFIQWAGAIRHQLLPRNQTFFLLFVVFLAAFFAVFFAADFFLVVFLATGSRAMIGVRARSSGAKSSTARSASTFSW